jgi:hypothetical protein
MTGVPPVEHRPLHDGRGRPSSIVYSAFIKATRSAFSSSLDARLIHFLNRASSAACEMASSISDLAPLAAIPPSVWPST